MPWVRKSVPNLGAGDAVENRTVDEQGTIVLTGLDAVKENGVLVEQVVRGE